jgi:hypothetical protein
MTELNAWSNFYVIVGTSAGALVGLQFVLVSLIAGRPVKDANRATAAFATPTVVYFATVLMLAGMQTARWRSICASRVGISGARHRWSPLLRVQTGPISIPYSSFRGFEGPSAFANSLKIRVSALS